MKYYKLLWILNKSIENSARGFEDVEFKSWTVSLLVILLLTTVAKSNAYGLKFII